MIEELKQWGCDTAGAMERMVDDEEFYRECLTDVVEDPCFESLGRALEARDVPAAFDAAHTLKGVLANLGLTQMYDATVRIVEPLRAGDDQGLMPAYEELLRQRERLREIVENAG